MMNENAMPNRASASIRPIPMNIVVRTWFAYSGWRAIASTDLPIRTPSPMPGPIAASPITRPFPMVFRPGVMSAACATRWNIRCLPFSVLFRQCPADVRAGEDGEDECLQTCNEDLEAHERDRERERERRQDPRLRAVLQEEDRPDEEDRQQEVPGDEVGGETDGQGDRPDDDVGDELDHHQQRVAEQGRCLADDAGVLEVAEEPVLLDAHDVVRQPRDDRERQRERRSAVRGEAEARDDLEEVPDQDEEEQRRQQRQEPVGVLPEDRDRDLLTDEGNPELHHRLELAGYDGRAAKREVEQHEHDHEGEEHPERDEVQTEVPATEVDPRPPAAVDEVLGARGLEGGRQDRRQRAAPSNDHMSACRRPESVLASTTSNAIVTGTSVRANASGENHAIVLSSTSAMV